LSFLHLLKEKIKENSKNFKFFWKISWPFDLDFGTLSNVQYVRPWFYITRVQSLVGNSVPNAHPFVRSLVRWSVSSVRPSVRRNQTSSSLSLSLSPRARALSLLSFCFSPSRASLVPLICSTSCFSLAFVAMVLFLSRVLACWFPFFSLYFLVPDFLLSCVLTQFS
jgi:hypothetical protein